MHLGSAELHCLLWLWPVHQCYLQWGWSHLPDRLMSCCWLLFPVCVSYWSLVLLRHTVNCIHGKAVQRSGDSWKLMEMMISWGGCQVSQNMGGHGSGRRKLGGQAREDEGGEQRLELQGLVHARMLSVQPGLVPWMTVGFTGQLGFFNFLWPLTASTIVAPWWITDVPGFPPVLTPTELLHLLSCFVCTEKRISEFLQTTVCPKSILLSLFFQY